VFTLNNPCDADEEAVLSLPYKYLIFGRETGENGTPHFQGYCELDKKMAFGALKKLLPTAHIEHRKGTASQASEYCKKDGDFVERGTISNPGKRTDLQAFVEEAKAGRMSKRDLIENHTGIAAKYPRFAELVQDTYHPPQPMEVLDFHWFHGATGTGKSKTARELYPGAYIKNTNKWWDMYDGQDAVIIEEWSPENERFLAHHLKQWCDHYPFNAEIKGANKFIRPKTIIVTSNWTLSQCFQDRNNYEPLERRFKIREFR